MERPTGSNADEWALFISENSENLDSIGFLAVQIAEAIEANVSRDRNATMTAVVYTVGGTVEGHPTSSINYLQRLRQLVEIEKAAKVVCRFDWSSNDDDAAATVDKLRRLTTA